MLVICWRLRKDRPSVVVLPSICCCSLLTSLEDNFFVDVTKNGEDFLQLVGVQVEGSIAVEGVFIDSKTLKLFEFVVEVEEE